MAYLSQLFSLSLQNTRQTLVLSDINSLANVCVRYASKKSSGSTRNKGGHPKPKHRGWKILDGGYVQRGNVLATQRTLRFHPGLNVGIGRNQSLFAIEAGRVLVTCEKIDPNWDHSWVKATYGGRENQVIYKKYFNVLPEPQHNRFKLINII